MSAHELSWKQYEKHIELYRFYWEIVVKINTFHYAITGAILSFYFTHTKTADVKWSLLLPAFLSICWAVVFAYGAVANMITRQDVFDLRDAMGLKVSPEFLVLTVVLGIFCLAHAITAGALVYLMYGGSA